MKMGLIEVPFIKMFSRISRFGRYLYFSTYLYYLKFSKCTYVIIIIDCPQITSLYYDYCRKIDNFLQLYLTIKITSIR